MNIAIYTTPETLEYKKGATGFEEFFWHFWNPPKKLKVGEKIYFATKGFIRGYFICNYISYISDETVCWNKNTWKDVEPIPCKPFQGFKYMEK